MFYKVLTADVCSCHGGDMRWTPGEWVVVDGPIVPCESGLHFCDDTTLRDWLEEAIWEFEPRGIVENAGDKLVCAEGRIVRQLTGWNERTARLFACDCAERVARLSSDARVATAISTARAFANGNATATELAAARDAALAAAWAAARDAAWAAASAAALVATREEAWAAASAAARAAAWAAESAAARDASRGAAGAAARDAALAAAWAAAREEAWAAASAAALVATREEALDATSAGALDATSAGALDAEMSWQNARLLDYVHGRIA
jgi:hypothetical protein